MVAYLLSIVTNCNLEIEWEKSIFDILSCELDYCYGTDPFN